MSSRIFLVSLFGIFGLVANATAKQYELTCTPQHSSLGGERDEAKLKISLNTETLRMKIFSGAQFFIAEGHSVHNGRGDIREFSQLIQRFGPFVTAFVRIGDTLLLRIGDTLLLGPKGECHSA